MHTQKLVVKSQFMGVRPCKIEINRFLLLIGEQATGKSTIAKLIYFFQTLPDELYNKSLINFGRKSFEFVSDINLVARKKFLSTFGPTSRSKELFEIIFHYNEENFLRVYQGSDGLTYAEFSKEMAKQLKSAMRNFLEAPPSTSSEMIIARETFLKDIYQTFQQENTKFNYIIAGRNSVVAYPDLIIEKVKYELEKIVEDEVRSLDFEKTKRRGNEILFLDFVAWSEDVRQYFKENGGTFSNVSRNLRWQLKNPESLSELSEISSSILKGSYKSTDYGETIVPDRGSVPVPLKDGSSGQQEVLRILQGLFISVGSPNRREFLFVEEPEAHLHPMAQKELVNAFAIFLNAVPQGRLLITTHSPYILACVNILLFSYITSLKIKEAKDKVPISDKFWLNPSDFNAYSLGQQTEYCINIKDTDTGLIDQNYLDTISELLGRQFEELYSLLP